MSVGRVDSVVERGGREYHVVTVIKDDKGYGMTVSGNDPVQVQSVVKGGAAWRAGVRKGDLLLVVNGNAVETEGHAHVVELIKASPTVVLKLQRNSTITAPLPVCREKQLQVDHNKVLTIQLMLETEIRYIESLRNSLAKNPSDRKQSELDAAEMRRSKLQQQLYMQTSPTSLRAGESILPPTPQHSTDIPPRQGFLSNLPRSLSSLTGQSLRGIKANLNNNNNNNHGQASPVTCLDGAATLPPPLPPRGPSIPPPPPPPISSSTAVANHHNSQHQRHYTAPNSIAVQMAYPLVTGTPPLIQNAAPGHHRSKSSPEELNEINNANDDKEWELVNTPPGTPPPPYPSSPVPPITLDTQRAIISMEEDDMSPTLPRNSFSSGGFNCVDTLSIARLAVFLNWVAGERRPAQAVLLYFLTEVYSKGPSTVLARWAYELHSAFVVPGAPLALQNVDENMAREIDDALIKDHDKEDVLRKIFLKVREKAKEEMTQQLREFQVKRQLGLGTFYGPSDSVLNQCELDKTQEMDVITKYLLPSLNIWMENSSMDPWGATKGSPSYSILAAAVPPMLQHIFCLKTQFVNNAISSTPPGSPPRPAFLQRDKLYKQRVKHLNKSSNHPLVIRGHHLSPITVTSVCHCNYCQLLIWGVAPQAYNCSDCKLKVHRSCAREVEEPCCGPTAPPTRISRLMEKLAPQPAPPLGNSHQHLDSNQHHHPHEKRQKKSSATSHFLNMDRSTRKVDEDSASALDTSTTSHNTSDKEYEEKEVPEIPIPLPDIVIQESQEGDEEKDDKFEASDIQSLALVLTDSECAANTKKKHKIKHRKTMSMSSTIELVKCLGEDWIEAAKREIDEHSKKKELTRKKDKELMHNKINKEKLHFNEKMKSDSLDNNNGAVTLVLYDATIGETDDFEIAEEHDPKKHSKKKDQGKNRKLSAVSMMNAQKNTVKMLAKASSVTALNFIRSKRKHALLGPMDHDSIDHAILASDLLLEHERAHTNIVQDPKAVGPVQKYDKKDIDKDAKIIRKIKKDSEKAAKISAAKDKLLHQEHKKDSVDKHAKSSSGEEDDNEVYYDAHSGEEDVIVEDTFVKVEHRVVTKPVKPKRASGSSLKRTGGGRRRTRKRNSLEDQPPPLPPRQNNTPVCNQRHTSNQSKHPHWLFGNSLKGDSRRDDDTGTESTSQQTDSSHFSSEHSAERADSTSQSRVGIAVRPVTRAESYRDRAGKVPRTKRKTSDPNQLTSNRETHDVEILGAVGGPSALPSGGSSNSSLSSKSNDSTQVDQGSGSEWSDEEDSSIPWSSRAPPELLATMSNLARKRQDLIHELICSEWSHVRWLRVLRRVYLIPLQRAGSTLLSPQELRSLIPNLPDVLQRHRALAKELRALQQAPKVYTGPVADALISMLGEAKYAAVLSRFCGGQGLALDALRERKKRNKELNAFLAKCEQEPICARLGLRDLLACVWQRLTKYQLLLEEIRKSAGAIEEEVDGSSDGTQCEDFAKVSYALELAKDVLNKVNSAIKTTENEHRLRSIQNKLEIRLNDLPDGGGDLKKLDLTKHSLVMEGTLNIRQDSSKKVNVLALLMRECLILLHTDGDKYILKAIPQSTHSPLSPIVYWDKVIYRSNASVKFGFFLVNFDGVLYEFSSLTAAEYNTWAKHLMEYARGLGGPKNVIADETTTPLPSTPPTITPSPDVPNGTPEPEQASASETKQEPKPPENPDDGNKVNGAAVSVVSDDEAGICGRQPKMDSSLIDPAILTISEPPPTLVATLEITPEEKIRRAEKKISSAMLTVSDASKELCNSKTSLRGALPALVSQEADNLPTHSTQNLILQAQDHVNKLTEVLLRALRVPITECSSSKCRMSFGDGLCDTCSAKYAKYLGGAGAKVMRTHSMEGQKGNKEGEVNMDSIVMLEEVGESSTDPTTESDIEQVESTGAGLRSILSELMIRLAGEETEKNLLRARLQKADDRIHYLHHLHKDCKHTTDDLTRSGIVESKPSSSNEANSGPG